MPGGVGVQGGVDVGGVSKGVGVVGVGKWLLAASFAALFFGLPLFFFPNLPASTVLVRVAGGGPLPFKNPLQRQSTHSGSHLKVVPRPPQH